MAHANLVYIAAKDGVHPDTGVLADDDVADELGGVVDVAGFGELGRDAFVGADHGYLMLEALCRTTVSQDAMVRGERPSHSHLANFISLIFRHQLQTSASDISFRFYLRC